jgi:hypothetical protein
MMVIAMVFLHVKLTGNLLDFQFWEFHQFDPLSLGLNESVMKN